MRWTDSNKGHLWSSTPPNLCTWFVRKLLNDRFHLVTLRQRHRVFSVKYMNMVIYGDLEGPGEKVATVYFDVLLSNSRTGPKKTASNRMADVLRKTRRMYLRLFSSCLLNQLFVTIRTYRTSAIRCWFLWGEKPGSICGQSVCALL